MCPQGPKGLKCNCGQLGRQGLSRGYNVWRIVGRIYQTKKKEIMNKIGKFLMLTALVVATLYLVNTGFNRGEEQECKKLVAQASEYGRYDSETQTGFYIMKWQDEMCRAHGIQIDAAVL